MNALHQRAWSTIGLQANEPPTPRVTVSRDLLQRAAAICEWPAVTLNTTAFAAETWNYILDRSTPQERAALLLALEPHLLAATPAGRSRLGSVGCHHNLEDCRPVVVGDEELLPLVEHACALLPDQVRAFIVREVAFVTICSSAAWTASATLAGDDGCPKHRVIVLGPRADLRVTLHECGHAWHSPLRGDTIGPGQAVSAAGELGLRQLAAEQGWLAAIDTHVRDSETLAEGLALAWLLKPSGRAPA